MKKLNLKTLSENMQADGVLIIDLFQLFRAWSEEEKRLHKETKESNKDKHFKLGKCASLNKVQQDLQIILQAHNLRKKYERTLATSKCSYHANSGICCKY
jgi:hypothetical protein